MGQHITIDLIERPSRGVFSTRRAVRKLSRQHGVPGLSFATVEFTKKLTEFPVTPRRVGILFVWESREQAERLWSQVVAPLTQAREHWHLLGEVARADSTAPVGTWHPDATGSERLAGSEPALILIRGNFANRHAGSFLGASVATGAQLTRASGYLGGVGLHRSVFEMTSLSCWASMKEARLYAYGAGAHADVMRKALDQEWSSANAFMAIRPLRTSGTFNGSNPFRDSVPLP